jgi:hypothetical protein
VLADYDGVKTLHTLAPTNEDMAVLKEYDGEVAALGKVRHPSYSPCSTPQAALKATHL